MDIATKCTEHEEGIVHHWPIYRYDNIFTHCCKSHLSRMVRDVVSDFPKVSTVFQTIMNKEPAHNFVYWRRHFENDVVGHCR